MRNMVDPNLSREDAQGVPIKPDAIQPNGAETVTSDSNSDDSRRELILRSIGRCPYHAMLEELDLWQEKEPER